MSEINIVYIIFCIISDNNISVFLQSQSGSSILAPIVLYVCLFVCLSICHNIVNCIVLFIIYVYTNLYSL